jgi:hypothetical protein
MLESIARQGQYNHYSNRSIQSAANRPVNMRCAFMLSAAFLMLTTSSPKSEAEEVKQNSDETENTGQILISGQAQADEQQSTTVKARCRPRKPCPDPEKSN